MREVAVAFPTSEAAGEVIAQQLRSEGIFARVDRGLSGSYQVAQLGQITVFVDEAHAKRAREIVDEAGPRNRSRERRR
jgi:hypothetical protein